MLLRLGDDEPTRQSRHDRRQSGRVGREGVEAVRITRAQLIAGIRQRLEHLMGEIANALKELGFSGRSGVRWC
jgi:cell division protein FtsA